MAECLFCGQEEVGEVLELWTDNSFMIDTCCAGMYETLSRELSLDASASATRSGSPWVRSLVADACGIPVRRLVEHGGQLLADFDLKIQPVTYGVAKAFVVRHHKHCGPPAGWKFGASIANGPTTRLGVVMVGRPVSRHLDQTGTTLEVNRLCLDRDLPDALRWNACSKLYAWAAKEAKARGYRHIVTYIREDEPGTSLIAAGWEIEASTAGGSWARDSRPRISRNTVRKVRWGKRLGRTAPEMRMAHAA